MSQSSIGPIAQPPFSEELRTSTHRPLFSSRPRTSKWLLRVIAIVVLFAAQVLALTVYFDAESISKSSEVWAWFFRFAPSLPRIGMTWLVLVPVFAYTRIREHALAFDQAANENQSWWIWWWAQWASFAALTIASQVIFGASAIFPLNGATWGVVWITSAALCCMCGLFAIAPRGFWWSFAVRERWVLLAALATSVAATSGGRLFQTLWKPLGDCTFHVVQFWLSLIYSDSVVSDAELRLLGTQRFYVEIAPHCSGYEGIGLVSVFTLAFLAMFRRSLRFPRAWLLLPIGIVAIWTCNTLRIAALIVIGTEYSQSVALGGFHSQAGWILFNLVSLGLMTGALRSRFFTRSSETFVCKVSPVVSYLAPFLTLTGLSMLIAAMVDDSAALYPLTVIVSLGVLWFSRDLLRRLDWKWSPAAILIGIAVFVVWTGLACFDRQAGNASQTSLPSYDTINGLVWTVFRVFGSVVTVPIIEELAFRGFFLRRLVKFDFESIEYRAVPVWSILFSSLAFGAMHQLWIGGILAGLCYAWVVRRRGNLTDAIQAHAVTNALIAVTVLMTGATWLW